MGKWKILEDICYLTAIDKNSLDLFVGRQQQAALLGSRLSSPCTVVIEGQVGVGKTSIGNYARFKSGQFSPTQEIICEPSWGVSEFLATLISTILKDVAADEDLRFQLSAPSKRYDELKKKYSGTDISSGLSLNGSYLGTGVGISRTKSESIKISQIGASNIFSDFKHLCSIISDAQNGKPLIFQLNNLDLGATFTEIELKRFLNFARDPFINSPCSWILTGKTGLSAFIKTEVERIKEITSQFILLPPLNQEEVLQAIIERANQAKFNGTLPIGKDLFDHIYQASNGSFRTILMTIQKLLYEFGETEKAEISLNDACNLFYKRSAFTLQELFSKHKKAKAALIHITHNRNIRLVDLASHLKMDPANLKKMVTDLENELVLYSIKMGESRGAPRVYQTREEIYFAMMHLAKTE